MVDDPTLRILDAIAQVRTGLTDEIGRLRADMQRSIKDVQGSVKDVQGSISTVQFTLMARIDRVQDTLAGVKDDIVVNFAHSDRVERVARAGTEETRALAEQVTAMGRQIRRLSTRLDEIEGKA